MSRRRMTVLTTTLVAVAAGIGAANAEGPVDHSRQAAQHLALTGRVEVRWFDEDGTHRQELDIIATNGVVIVQGGRRLATSIGVGVSPFPDVGANYDVAYRPGPLVAGRPTRLAEVRRGARVRERLFVDVATGLILRREELGTDGRARRVVR